MPTRAPTAFPSSEEASNGSRLKSGHLVSKYGITDLVFRHSVCDSESTLACKTGYVPHGYQTYSCQRCLLPHSSRVREIHTCTASCAPPSQTCGSISVVKYVCVNWIECKRSRRLTFETCSGLPWCFVDGTSRPPTDLRHPPLHN